MKSLSPPTNPKHGDAEKRPSREVCPHYLRCLLTVEVKISQFDADTSLESFMARSFTAMQNMNVVGAPGENQIFVVRPLFAIKSPDGLACETSLSTLVLELM